MAKSQALKDAAETSHKLQQELAEAKATIQKYKKREATLRNASKPKKLIARPTGQPGRDYSLQREMGLKGKSIHFRRLHRIVKDMVHQQLEVEKTISQQDKVHLEATKVNIAKLAPFFNRFAGLWPIHAMIRTYLLNMQTRRRKDLQDEKQWTSAHGRGEEEREEVDAGSADEDGDEEMDAEGEGEDGVGDTEDEEGDEEGDQGEDEDDEGFDEEPEEIFTPVKKRTSKSKPSALVPKASSGKNVIAKSSSGKTASAKAPSRKTGSGTVSNQKKRKAISAPANSPPPKKHKPTQSTAKPTPPPHPKKPTPKILTCADIPAECPTVMCDEHLPAEENDRLLSLFQRLQDLKFSVGSTGVGVSFLQLEICAAITEENKKNNYLQIGARNEWPIDIEFPGVVSRILELQEPLLEMLQDAEALRASPVFSTIPIEYRLQNLSFLQVRVKTALSRCREGVPMRLTAMVPRASFIINSTIYRMLANEDEQLENDLCNTLSTIIHEDPDKFDDYDSASNLISVKDFVSFIVTPHIASLLISEDHDISIEDATQILEESSDFGDLIQRHDEEDSVIDQLHHKNIRQMNRGKNYFFTPQARQATAARHSRKRQAFMLDDFKEPKPNPKPKSAPKSKKKAVLSKGEEKGKAIAVSGGYGLRSKSRKVVQE
ncbi:hypothetical protein C8F04DRAFT_1346843 [Mycena alexandri]|uniref:Restriction of telomere capping protein 4 C-terminal domain-containing protein n=1 Tax=Mycena alexandri TaxID=1745969 RepID=A0AAD6RWL6_9AGAR|nr:hypothetical protein C8F04DRAFT_1346843 [Mycena alexandri]